jgi:hypothetical protein
MGEVFALIQKEIHVIVKALQGFVFASMLTVVAHAAPVAAVSSPTQQPARVDAVSEILLHASATKPSCSWNGGYCNTLVDCCTGICDTQMHVCFQDGGR